MIGRGDLCVCVWTKPDFMAVTLPKTCTDWLVVTVYVCVCMGSFKKSFQKHSCMKSMLPVHHGLYDAPKPMERHGIAMRLFVAGKPSGPATAVFQQETASRCHVAVAVCCIFSPVGSLSSNGMRMRVFVWIH